MRKQLNIIFLVLVICLSIFAATVLAANISFTDVKTSDWFYEDVRIAVEMDLVNGKSETIYAPDDNLTYGEAVKLAACMHQRYSTGSVSLKNGEPWYQSYVDYCKLNRIISADYPWLENASRADYMDIFSRALPDTALSPINTVADDSIPDVPSTHKNAGAIYKLYRAGILQGVDAAHNCKPETNIKRSEVAAILTRMMNADKRISFIMGEIKKEESAKLKITKQPTGQIVTSDTFGVFSIEAQGVKPLSFQWQVKTDLVGKWKDLEDMTGIKMHVAGSKTDELKLKSLEKTEVTYAIRCIVKDADKEEVVSNEVIFRSEYKTSALTIIQQPKDVEGFDTETVSITIKAEGEGLEYQWEALFSDEWTILYDLVGLVSDSDTDRIDINLDYFGVGVHKIRCTVSDKHGNSEVSKEAKIEVFKVDTGPILPITILKQPKGFGGTTGQTVVLELEAEGGSGKLHYQWQSSPLVGALIGDNSFSNIGENKSYYITSVGIIPMYYRCIITDEIGQSVTSDKVLVTRQ